MICEVCNLMLKAIQCRIPIFLHLGYDRVREGFKVNVKVVERIYREERLWLRRTKRKKIPREGREGAWCPIAANQRWSLDFTSDALANGRKFRTANLKDDCTRECPAIEVDFSLPGERVVDMLERVARERGYPPFFQRARRSKSSDRGTSVATIPVRLSLSSIRSHAALAPDRSGKAGRWWRPAYALSRASMLFPRPGTGRGSRARSTRAARSSQASFSGL